MSLAIAILRNSRQDGGGQSAPCSKDDIEDYIRSDSILNLVPAFSRLFLEEEYSKGGHGDVLTLMVDQVLVDDSLTSSTLSTLEPFEKISGQLLNDETSDTFKHHLIRRLLSMTKSSVIAPSRFEHTVRVVAMMCNLHTSPIHPAPSCSTSASTSSSVCPPSSAPLLAVWPSTQRCLLSILCTEAVAAVLITLCSQYTDDQPLSDDLADLYERLGHLCAVLLSSVENISQCRAVDGGSVDALFISLREGRVPPSTATPTTTPAPSPSSSIVSSSSGSPCHPAILWAMKLGGTYSTYHE